MSAVLSITSFQKNSSDFLNLLWHFPVFIYHDHSLENSIVMVMAADCWHYLKNLINKTVISQNYLVSCAKSYIRAMLNTPDHWRWATLGADSTWIGDRLGTPYTLKVNGEKSYRAWRKQEGSTLNWARESIEVAGWRDEFVQGKVQKA